MRLRCFLFLFALLTIHVGAGIARAQDSSIQGERKVVRQTKPRYPDLARRVHLAGTVKLVAIVTPEGNVKKVEPMGGNPILIQAAQDAISEWKFAPAGSESRQLVELHFHP